MPRSGAWVAFCLFFFFVAVQVPQAHAQAGGQCMKAIVKFVGKQLTAAMVARGGELLMEHFAAKLRQGQTTISERDISELTSEYERRGISECEMRRHLEQMYGAQTRLALACIGTDTGGTINFESRWGQEDAWTPHTADPGRWTVLKHYYAYPGENSSPQLQIRFDGDVTSGINFVGHTLRPYATLSESCEQGRLYHFYLRGSRIMLNEDN